MDEPDIERLCALMGRHAVRYDDFTLASGRKSRYYHNGKRATLRPSAAKLIGEAPMEIALRAGSRATRT